KSAHRHPDSLPENGGFANSGIGNPKFAVFFLHSFQALVHVAYFATVFTKNQSFGIFAENGIKVIAEDYPTIHFLGIVGVGGKYFFNGFGIFFRFGIKMCAVFWLDYFEII